MIPKWEEEMIHFPVNFTRFPTCWQSLTQLQFQEAAWKAYDFDK